jgi:hypothetical protein
VWSNQGCEVRLRVRTDNTDHVDDPLELPRVADELGSEYGGFDGRMRRGLWAQRFKIALKLEGGSEILFDGCAAQLAKRWSREREPASCVSLSDTRQTQRSIKSPPSGIGDDGARRVGFDLAVIELGRTKSPSTPSHRATSTPTC